MWNFFKRRKLNRQIKESIDAHHQLWNADLATIWSITDPSDFLIGMQGWVCRKCAYGDQMEALSPAERILYVNFLLESEVNNGGFAQFLYNSSGDFTGEVVSSLRAIGAHRTADIYARAISALGIAMPENWEEREALLDTCLSDEISAVLEECDGLFFAGADDLVTANIQFIQAHREDFT